MYTISCGLFQLLDLIIKSNTINHTLKNTHPKVKIYLVLDII